MSEYLFTFQSITQGQTGQRLLRNRGVAADLQRTPKAVAVKGCGYSLAVSENQLQRTAEVFRERNVSYKKVYRRLEDGALEEVLL